jgi:hypothetical protein
MTMTAKGRRLQARSFLFPAWISSPALSRARTGVGRVAAAGVPVALAVGLLPALFSHTYRLAIRPRMEAETNPYLRIAATLQRTTRPDDLILATGAGWLAQGEVYIPYFSGRPLLALQQVLKQRHGDRAASFDYIRQYMERCWGRGGQVYLLQEVLSSGPAYAVLGERYGLSQAEARRFFQPYLPRRAVQAGPHSIWVLSNPAAQPPQTADARRRPAPVRTTEARQRLSRA